MPECRTCGVALAPHELDLCAACWEATERDDHGEPPPWQVSDRGHFGRTNAERDQ